MERDVRGMLRQDIMYLPGVGPARKMRFVNGLGVRTFGDLVEFFPYKYVDRSRFYTIKELTVDMPYVQVRGRILSFETFPFAPHRERVVAHFTDGTGVVDLIWFRGGKYAKRKYKVGEQYIVFGKPAIFNGYVNIAHPEIDLFKDEDALTKGLQPYYSVGEKLKQGGITSRSLEKMIRKLFSLLDKELPETLPIAMINRLKLVSRDTALRTIHFPKTSREVILARQRLKFEELFFVQLNIVRYTTEHRRKYKGFIFRSVGAFFNGFYHNNLPFELTSAQKKVMREIRSDMGAGRQMNRLLQGDVGSGKTLVALMSMLLALDNGYQACMVAPTEILAAQHFETLRNTLYGLNIRIEILTGHITGKKRKEILSTLATGEIQILVGTHAIMEENVQFSKLGLAVIDEQHRFGVAQRATLWSKNETPPHILVMTATPIPRTLAMTIYGDLDVSVIDEMPPGRRPILTKHIVDRDMPKLYDGLRRQMNDGRQVYVVFPLIEESEKIDLKNLERGYQTLQQIFSQYTLCKVHGRMKSSEKEKEMQRFVSAEANMLVATTVIEVGVNVPNASVMVIMDAQRYGLSQLHQLRGRVGRGAKQSYCILVTPPDLDVNKRKRIEIMCMTNDGFRIAEADLRLRGPGDLEGTKQSGMAFDLKIADIARDGQLVQMARDEARRVIEEDPQEKNPNYAMMWNRLKELKKTNIDWSTIS